MTAPRILFVPDCGPVVGGGHVMRCLTLAGALRSKGATVQFLAPPEAAELLDAFGGADISRLPLDEADDLAALVHKAGEAAREADIVVVDHYRLDAEAESRLRPAKVVVMDDLADRLHDCDLLIDSGLTREAGDYAQLAPAARVLVGPEYALVRPKFAELRPQALERRRRREPVRRVLVGLGLTDLEETTCRVIEGLHNDFGKVAVDIVTGKAAPSLPGLRRMVAGDDRFTLHLDTARMAELMAEADIGIGAGGSSVWERACLGLPSITVVLAENQRPLTSELHRRGATLALDRFVLAFEAMLSGEWYGLLESAEARLAMSEASAALCDGLGARRVAQAVLSLV